MTQMITITIRDEDTYQALKKESNKSGLINDLLKEYFSNTGRSINPKAWTLEEVRQRKAKREKKIEDTLNNNELGELEEVEEDLIEAESKLKESERKKKEERIKAFEGMILHLFYTEGQKGIDDYARMYEIERLNYESLYDWGVEKGLTPKPPKEEEK